jgi:hypothetical protein
MSIPYIRYSPPPKVKKVTKNTEKSVLISKPIPNTCCCTIF